MLRVNTGNVSIRDRVGNVLFVIPSPTRSDRCQTLYKNLLKITPARCNCKMHMNHRCCSSDRRFCNDYHFLLFSPHSTHMIQTIVKCFFLLHVIADTEVKKKNLCQTPLMYLLMKRINKSQIILLKPNMVQ